ncbi:hypothetical protein [Yersinia enterocolitica]
MKELPDLLTFGSSDFVMAIDGLACQLARISHSGWLLPEMSAACQERMLVVSCNADLLGAGKANLNYQTELPKVIEVMAVAHSQYRLTGSGLD